MSYITAVNYDKSVFPMSPHMLSYSIYDAPEALVIEVNGDHSLVDNFSCAVDRDTKAVIRGLQGDSYTMEVSVEGEKEKPTITFSMVNSTTGETDRTFKMDQSEFLETYRPAYVAWCLENSGFINDFTAPMEFWTEEMFAMGQEFETQWSIKFLKDKVFGDAIEAPEKFWAIFTRDLDVALMPINIEMERAREGEPEKPWEIELGKNILAN